MERNPKATCATCPFWKTKTSQTVNGQCRAKSPVVYGNGPDTFPWTARGEWCGEHPDFEGEEEPWNIWDNTWCMCNHHLAVHHKTTGCAFEGCNCEGFVLTDI